MTCQGGCVGGAGQPYGLKAKKRKRGTVCTTDAAAMFKRAERNPIVTSMLAAYGEERCHELLHVTTAHKRQKTGGNALRFRLFFVFTGLDAFGII